MIASNLLEIVKCSIVRTVCLEIYLFYCIWAKQTFSFGFKKTHNILLNGEGTGEAVY